MSGYMMVIGPCYACQRTISFNADLVPSVVVDGQREPVCQSCIDRESRERVKHGLPPITVLPGAYEPQEQS